MKLHGTRRQRGPNTGLVWAYCRVSTLKTEQELSLEEQIRWAEAFARDRSCRLVLFKERASAKTVIGRPQCAKLLGLIETAKEDLPQFLIATSFDRLSRDMTDTMLIARSLRQGGVKLYIRDRGEIAMDSFADQAALVGQAMGGHAENEAKSNRCKASWERRHRQGKPMSNKSPYGLQLRAERDVEEPISAPWVRKAFEWYASGIGMHTIALRLKAGAPAHRVITSKFDANGAPVIRERYHVWESNRIRKLLCQTRYRGTIVQPDLFDRVQEAIRSKPRWRQQRGYEYPLSGAVKCRFCGRSFHGHASGATSRKRGPNGTVVVYSRYRRVRYYLCVVCNYSINADVLEQWFKEAVAALRADPELFQQWADAKRTSDADAMRQEKHLIEERLHNGSFERLRQRAWQLALSDSSIQADLARQLRSISDDEGRCRDRLAQIIQTLEQVDEAHRTRERALSLIRNFQSLYDAAQYEYRRELANALVCALGGAVASKDGLLWLEPARRGTLAMDGR